jgi:hypothetical protein
VWHFQIQRSLHWAYGSQANLLRTTPHKSNMTIPSSYLNCTQVRVRIYLTTQRSPSQQADYITHTCIQTSHIYKYIHTKSRLNPLETTPQQSRHLISVAGNSWSSSYWQARDQLTRVATALLLFPREKGKMRTKPK